MKRDRLPTDIALGHLLDSLRALNQKPRDKRIAAIDRTTLANIERRLQAAVRRDRTGCTDRDGYPSTTLGGGHGTHIAGSTTETAALSRPERDHHHDLTLRATTALEQSVIHLQVLVSALNSLDDLTNTTGPTPRTCQACTGHRPLGGNQPVAHRGTVGDRLATATDLCADCHSFVRQTADPGSRDGYLPTREQIAHHDQRGRWRIRQSA